jgi:peptidoglycan/xylan/chitin deacetylase (PgdA/CDA1 family)
VRQAIILMYHRVTAGPPGPYALSVTPEEFRAQLDAVRSRAEPSTLDGLSDAAERPRVVVTFDDGYADNFEVAAPIAQSLEVPMAVYVTSGVLGDPAGLWWDRLDAVCERHGIRALESPQQAARSVEVTIGGVRLSVELTGAEASARLLWALHTRLRRRPPEEIDAVIDEVAAQLGVAAGGRSEDRLLTVAELRELAALEHVTIGAHTVRHERLADLSPSEQFSTVSRSKADLERLIGCAVEHFAYPFGGPTDIDRDSVRVARRAGFKTAVTTSRGTAWRATPRFRLPRYMVSPGTSPDRLLADVGLSA